jgi:uncharacterized protein YjbI with pentapeptide repeats
VSAPRPAPRPPSPPRLPAQLEPAELAEGRLTGVVISGAGPLGAVHSLDLDEARLVACDLAGAQLSHLGLLDCELSRCDLANVLARDASFDHVRCADSRLTGLQWPEGALVDTVLSDCRADLAAFRFVRAQRVVFERCVLRDADFHAAQLESVVFVDCDLTGASFERARCRNCELRGCRLEGLRGADGLGGAALEWPAILELAGPLAAAAGILVIDDEAPEDGAP